MLRYRPHSKTSEPRRYTVEMYASAAKSAFVIAMTLTFDL